MRNPLDILGRRALALALTLTLCLASPEPVIAQSGNEAQAATLEKEINDAVARKDSAGALNALRAYRELMVPMPPQLSLIEARLAHAAREYERSQRAFDEYFKTAKSDDAGYMEALGLYAQMRKDRETAQKEAEAQERERIEVENAKARTAQIEDARKRVPAVIAEIQSQMVKIPGGKFLMGNPKPIPGYMNEDTPAHMVRVGKFRIGKYEVTCGQYGVFAAITGRALPMGAALCPGNANLPVAGVSYHDSMAFIDWLNSNGGSGFRLPSEAEWEFAARAKSTRAYHWGDVSDPTRANPIVLDPKPVGSYPPNKFGLHDMLGNLQEWTADCWWDSYRDAPADGAARTCSYTATWVAMRGVTQSDRNVGTVSARAGTPVDNHFYGNGFRLAQDP